MAWKVHTMNENVRPTMTSYNEYDSKDDAVKAARQEFRKAHVRVILIEGPNGETIENQELETLCGTSL
jgi:hypothetical protein